MKKIIFLIFMIVVTIFYGDIITNKDMNSEFLSDKKSELKDKKETIKENILEKGDKKENIGNLPINKGVNGEVKKTKKVLNSKDKQKKNKRFFNGNRDKSKQDKLEENRKKREELEIRKKSDKFKKAMKDFSLETTIKTNKGVMSFYLYPEAAPVNVANFVYLVRRNFYNGLKFHRSLSGILIQGGDPLGNGFGSTGYTVKDEVVDWLNFEETGLLVMANSGPNTNSSQFFITLAPLPQLNEKYTIIGEIITREDLSLARVLREGDTIIDIEIKGKNVDTFLDYFQGEVKLWNENIKVNQK